MKKTVLLISLVCIFSLTACLPQNLDKNEVIATFKGNEIRTKDILIQYPLEDEYITTYLKEEIIIYEAKKSGITVPKQEINELKELLYSIDDLNQINDFHRQQAESLNITTVEYFESWSFIHLERNEYIQRYIKSKFDVPTSNEKTDEWEKEIEEHISELYKMYLNNGELLIH